MMATYHPAGLFSRAGVRYEVALDVLGSLIANCAEVLGIELSRPASDASIVRRAEVIGAPVRALR